MQLDFLFVLILNLSCRNDLDGTLDGNVTCGRIASGVLKDSLDINFCVEESNLLHDMSQWRNLFVRRKWNLIELNRAKYLQRMKALEAVELSEN